MEDKKQKAIKALESVSNPKIKDKYSQDVWKAKATDIASHIFGKNSSQVKHIGEVKFRSYIAPRVIYRDGGSKSYGSDGDNSIKCSKQARDLILGMIDYIEVFGVPEFKNEQSNLGTIVNVENSQSNNQTATQNQSVNIEFVWESLEDELTGSQLKELQAISNSKDNPEEKKNKIFSKLKEFGIDVVSKVLSSVILGQIQ